METLILNITLYTDANWLDSLWSLTISLPKMHISWTQLFPFLLWYIWIARNSNIFNHTELEIPPRIPYERVVEFIS